MKNVLLTLLGIIVAVGVLAGVGFAGYRIGYEQGALANTDGKAVPFMHGFQFGPQGMPKHNFDRDLDRGLNRGFGPGGFGMMLPTRGFGFFSPLFFLIRVAVLVLVIWLVYKLIKGSGWQLSLKRQQTDSEKVESSFQQD